MKAVDQVVRRWPTAGSRMWFDTFAREAAKDPNVIAVVVVGSAVRPRVASDDLDLVVVCGDVAAFKVKAPIEIDIRRAELGQVDEEIGTGHDLLSWAIRYGKAVLDKEGFWAGLVSRWFDHLPLPDVSVCAARAEAARRRMEDMQAIGDENALVDLTVAYQTHRARGSLAAAGIHPASRPELAGQLRLIGEHQLATDLDQAISARRLVHQDSMTAA